MTDSSNNPLVSVLMTAYNKENFIGEAIESVLTSTYNNFELIIVDDSSKDATVEIAKSYEYLDQRVKVYVNDTNLGDYPNRNKAASYAKGKYIKYLDADDFIYSWGLEVMVNAIEKFPQAGFGLSSKSSSIAPFPICIPPREIYLEHFEGYGHFDRGPGSSIINRDIFNSIGGFSGKRFVGDQEFWMNISKNYDLVKFPMDLYWNRLHHESEGAIERSMYLKQMNILRENILIAALYEIDCPLSSHEVITIMKKIQKQKIIFLIKTPFRHFFRVLQSILAGKHK